MNSDQESKKKVERRARRCFSPVNTQKPIRLMHGVARKNALSSGQKSVIFFQEMHHPDENLAKAEAALADLSAAIEASSVSDDVKAEASHLLAKGTFYTDYGTDSSKGVHSYGGGMSEKCFEQALAIVEEAKALLG